MCGKHCVCRRSFLLQCLHETLKAFAVACPAWNSHCLIHGVLCLIRSGRNEDDEDAASDISLEAYDLEEEDDDGELST